MGDDVVNRQLEAVKQFLMDDLEEGWNPFKKKTKEQSASHGIVSAVREKHKQARQARKRRMGESILSEGIIGAAQIPRNIIKQLALTGGKPAWIDAKRKTINVVKGYFDDSERLKVSTLGEPIQVKDGNALKRFPVGSLVISGFAKVEQDPEITPTGPRPLYWVIEPPRQTESSSISSRHRRNDLIELRHELSQDPLLRSWDISINDELNVIVIGWMDSERRANQIMKYILSKHKYVNAGVQEWNNGDSWVVVVDDDIS